MREDGTIVGVEKRRAFGGFSQLAKLIARRQPGEDLVQEPAGQNGQNTEIAARPRTAFGCLARKSRARLIALYAAPRRSRIGHSRGLAGHSQYWSNGYATVNPGGVRL